MCARRYDVGLCKLYNNNKFIIAGKLVGWMTIIDVDNNTSVATRQQFAYMPICLYFIIHIAYMQIQSDIVCVKYVVEFN